jgi:hypothetical protein
MGRFSVREFLPFREGWITVRPEQVRHGHHLRLPKSWKAFVAYQDSMRLMQEPINIRVGAEHTYLKDG